MGYVVGFSSGAFGVTGPEEKSQLAGLFRKAQSSITKGVEFVQLDLESISEFEEPDLEKKMKEEVMKKLNLTFGIHSETKAFGVEAAELDSALATEYDRAQRRLLIILERAGKIGSKYVLIHSSESDPFPLLSLKTQPLELVDFYGRSIKEFLNDEENKNKWLVDWLMKEEGKFMWVEILHGRTLDWTLEQVKKELKDKYRATGREITEQELNSRLEDTKKEYQDYFMDTVSSKSLHYGPERWAYFLVARWMEYNNDPLWNSIVNTSIKFFAERDSITPEEWLSKKKIQKKSVDDQNFRATQEIWVPAVSAKYIWGHLFPKTYEDPKKIIKKYNMPLVLESPMGGRGIEEWPRLANPIQYYHLVEQVNTEAGFDTMMIALDFEHMLSLRLDPKLVIKLLPEDAGKFVNVIHAGWPSTLAPAHLPIEIGSDQQRYLYERYYELRQKGMGKEKDTFIVFERGGPETFQQSIISLRLIVKFLKDGTPPDKLPAEFFGLDIGQMASSERQKVAIREHAYDPLKGLISAPEEEHGFLGRAAIEKGKGEEWRKEKYK